MVVIDCSRKVSDADTNKNTEISLPRTNEGENSHGENKQQIRLKEILCPKRDQVN